MCVGLGCLYYDKNRGCLTTLKNLNMCWFDGIKDKESEALLDKRNEEAMERGDDVKEIYS